MSALKNCKTLINEHSSGVLSTISLKLGGFPFGSIVPFCTDQYGFPVIYISTIAEHTKNIIADSRVSLMLATTDNSDVQAKGRATIVGNAELIKETELISERYFRYFPNSRKYSAMHNFYFYRINPVGVRFIGGFGAIHWIEPIDFKQESPFWGTSEKRIIEHMNSDHKKDLSLYCSFYKGLKTTDKDTIEMIGVDCDGFDVSLNNQKLRFHFNTPISTTNEAREALVKMSTTANKKQEE